MTLLKWVVRWLPLPFLKRRISLKLRDQLEGIDAGFGDPRNRYSENVRSLYDCLNKAPITFSEDFSYFKDQRLDVHFKSSRTMADVVLKVKDKNGLLNLVNHSEDYLLAGNVTQEVRFIDWYSSPTSVKLLLESGLEVIYNYLLYVKYRDASFQNSGESTEQSPFSNEVISFYTSKVFALFVSDLIMVYWFVLNHNVRR